MEFKFPVTYTENPKTKPTDEGKLGFGRSFSDHMFLMNYTEGKGWHDGRIVPYAPLELDPSCMVLHYAQEVFEGMKAYRWEDGSIHLFRPYENEKFIMLFLDTKFRLLAKVEFTDNQRDKVSAEIPEVVSAINIYKPTYAIMAHNHTSGCALPSNEDHFATKKMNLICELHDVNLIDHIIISFDDSFSYKGEHLIDNIKRQSNLKNIFNGIKEG